MQTRKAYSVWEGNLKKGHGTISLGTGALEVPYGFSSRFENGAGSNPEELVGGAHAGCFSMALAHELAEAGHPPTRVETAARVHLEKSDGGFSIPRIDLETNADVPGIDSNTFQRIAESAKQNCPLSKLLSAADITLTARLLSGQRA